jgi:CheY-like chemotaxis protein
LSQVYGLCQRAGGLATIASEPGRGTCVRLFFPADTQAAEHAATKPSPLARDLHKHVLLVEDNAEVASALRPVLESFGCTVTWLDRAMEARDWLARQPSLPDLLLTDVIMPGGMDGIALAQHVRERWPELKVLVMTGYTEQLDTIARLGFQVLPKPCTVEVLAEAIRKATRAEAPA